MVYPKIKELREQHGLTQQQTADKLNLVLSTYRSYETGTREPSIEMLVMLSELYDVSIDYILDHQPKPVMLSPAEQEHIKKYRTLNGHGKYMVDTILNLEYKSSQELPEEEVIQTNCIVLTMYEDAVSAGTGEFLNDGRCVEITVDETPLTERADFVLRVAGDSMQPTYYDGDKVLVENTEELRYGDIGIFILNGEGYIKEYRSEGLYSHNEKYGIIKVTDDDNCRVVGKVIGKI